MQAARPPGFKSLKNSAKKASPPTKATAHQAQSQAGPGQGTATDVRVPLPMPAVSVQSAPSLHLDIQIHIASDASPDQIEAIFASMAKHLYKH